MPVVLTVQTKEEPVGTEVNAIDVVAPLQIETGFGVAIAAGVGLTVTGTFTGVPGQPFNVGITL